MDLEQLLRKRECPFCRYGMIEENSFSSCGLIEAYSCSLHVLISWDSSQKYYKYEIIKQCSLVQSICSI